MKDETRTAMAHLEAEGLLGEITNAMYLKEEQATLEGESGRRQYTLYTTIPGGLPQIRSQLTGKTWMIQWSSLFAFARLAGIDEP
jgi:hypothetical protein